MDDDDAALMQGSMFSEVLLTSYITLECHGQPRSLHFEMK